MIRDDILQIMAELSTFDADDIVRVLDMPRSTAADILRDNADAGVLDRVRVGHSFLYCLSVRALRRVAKLKPVDPDERALPLTWEGITPCDCVHDKPTRVIKSIVGMINHGATQVIEEQVYCATCGAWWSSARYTNTPF